MVVWGPTAEYVGRSVVKGDTLAIQGEIKYRTYEDKDGNTRYVTDINCQRLDKVGGRGNGTEEGGSVPAGPTADAPGGVADDHIPF